MHTACKHIRRYRYSMGLRVSAVAIIGLMLGCDRDTRPEQVGKAAPEFVLNDGTASVDLAKFRGRVVVLNFWASWCAPCLEEMPSLEAMQRQLPQIQVLAVASDEDLTDYQHYLAQATGSTAHRFRSESDFECAVRKLSIPRDLHH